MAPTVASGADPGSLACIHAAEDGQAARDRGEFLKARELLAVCTAGECPGIIRRDCSTWLEDVRTRTPSIVVVVRDAAGHDVSSAALTVDGAAHALNGAAIELDPGPHVLRVEGGEPHGVTEERVVVSAGEKGRAIALTVEQRSAVAGVPEPPPERPAARGHVPAASYVIGGVGVAGLAVFGVFGVMGMTDANNLRNTCAPACPPSDVDAAHTKLVVADIGLGVGVAALAIGTWLAVRALSTHSTHSTAVAFDLMRDFVRARSPGAALSIPF